MKRHLKVVLAAAVAVIGLSGVASAGQWGGVPYTYCETPAGNSGIVRGGGYPGATCSIPTPWGPAFGIIRIAYWGY